MAVRQLPLFPSNLDHVYNVQLDGLTTKIEWHYNARADRWSIHLYEIDDTPIRHGIRLVTGIDLLQRISTDNALPGSLEVVDTTGNDTESDADTLGEECQVRYTEGA